MKKISYALATTLTAAGLLLMLGAASASAQTTSSVSAPGTPTDIYASRHLSLQETEGLLSVAIALGITGFLLAEQNALNSLFGVLGGVRPRERKSGSRA